MNIYRKITICLLTSCGIGTGFADSEVSLLPHPQSIQISDQSFTMQSSLAFSATDETQKQVEFFAKELRNSTGWSIPVRKRGNVRFLIDPKIEAGYRLVVVSDGIRLSASDHSGLYHGFQTLLQLCPVEVYSKTRQTSLAEGWQIPCVKISDAPRFVWRGILVDVSREFQTKEEMLKLLDSMSMVKLNVLHWHLTDDQGWRPQIKAYPKLTPANGQSYIQQDLREIVAYAADRGITIVPEIDVPGHSGAVARAYPELCVAKPDGRGRYNVYDVSNPEVYKFLEKVLEELADIFPGEYIHLGADEVNVGCWKKDPGCVDYMEEHGLKNPHELQAHFVEKVTAIIEKNGRKAIAWDEALHGGAGNNLTIMSWRGVQPGAEAVKHNHKVVFCPVSALYYDRAQSRSQAHPRGYSANTVVMSQSYFFEPAIPTLDDAAKTNILGAQGCVWGEKIDGGDHLQRQVMPRGAALAESLWSPRESLDWNSFMKRLAIHRERLDARGIPYWWEPETTPVKVAEWKSVSSAGPNEIDVSDFISTSGLYEFLFHYKQGAGSFNILKAELLEDGRVVAADEHAYTGTVDGRRPNQFYLLKLETYDPNATYTLRYRIEAVKGGCSGVVIMIPALEKNRYAADRGPDTKSNFSGQKQPDEL